MNKTPVATFSEEKLNSASAATVKSNDPFSRRSTIERTSDTPLDVNTKLYPKQDIASLIRDRCATMEGVITELVDNFLHETGMIVDVDIYPHQTICGKIPYVSVKVTPKGV